MSRFLLVALCCLACLCPASATASATAQTPIGQAGSGNTLALPAVFNQKPTPAFGVQMYGAVADASQYSEETPEAGVDWLRWRVFWAAVEPINTTPDKFNFSSMDASMKAAVELNLRPLVTIEQAPKWAATYTNGPIDKVGLDEFAQFMGALVERYDGDGYQDAPGSPKVRIWELYNEPDAGDVIGAENAQPFWGPYGKEYAAMLCTAYRATKAANPTARVAIGGIAYDFFKEDNGPFIRSFIEDVLKNGGGECMDLMNFHYYPYFESRWAPYGDGLMGKTNYLRGILAKYGYGWKPFIVTEAGHHSDAEPTQPSTPQEQVNYLIKMSTQSAAAGNELMIWWTWIDLQGYWGETGLLTAAGVRKPSFDAYRNMAGKLSGATFLRTVPPSETGSEAARVYEFRAGQKLYVAWADSSSTIAIKLAGASFKVTDSLGVVQGFLLDGDDGSFDGFVRFNVSRQPIYLEQTP